MMKATILIITFLLGWSAPNVMLGQSDSARINQLIDQLSWKSITTGLIWHSQILTFEDSTVKELIKIGKPTSEKLLIALNDTNKTVISHIILTEIWSENRNVRSLDYKTIYKNCNELIGVHEICNGLVWEKYYTGALIIRQAEISKIKKYWNAKIIEGKDVTIGWDEKIKELEEYDKLNYPCNKVVVEKVYINNSSEINLSDLLNLLNKKNDDPQFESMWQILGNDSIIHKYNDCFYINYNKEGLSFRFGKDSILSTVFIEKQFEGKLLYNLKISDNRNEIEKKLGLPNSHYPHKNWDNYTDKHLYFYFLETGELQEFSISKR